MIIALYHLLPHQRCAFQSSGGVVEIEEIPYKVRLGIPIRLLVEDPNRAHIIIEKSKAEMVRIFTEHMEAAQDVNPGCGVLHIMVRAKPVCYASDDPAGPVYDPPLYWDNDRQEVVIPDGAAICAGKSEPYIGWAMEAIAAIVSLEVGPGPAAELILDCPFWTKPLSPDIPPLLLKTAMNRAQIAQRITETMGLGSPS